MANFQILKIEDFKMRKEGIFVYYFLRTGNIEITMELLNNTLNAYHVGLYYLGTPEKKYKFPQAVIEKQYCPSITEALLTASGLLYRARNFDPKRD